MMRRHRYSAEQCQFIIQNYKGIGTKELADKFNKRFGTNVTVSMMKNFKGNHKLDSGLTGRFQEGHVPLIKGTKGKYNVGGNVTSFKKGHTPLNTDPIGTEKLLTDGYIWVKVKNIPNALGRVNWVQKHVLLWEQENGPIPKGHCLIFLDGNRGNIAIDNLELISRSTLLILNKQGLISKDADVTRTSIQVAKLIDAIRKINKKRSKQ